MAELTRGHLQGLTVAVTGASGNVGTALLRRLTAPGSGVAGVRGLARAAAAAGAQQFVHMSSLGAYAGGAGGQEVAEDWPVTGIPTAQYSRDKAQAEHVVRETVGTSPGTVLTVVRPTLVL